MSVPLPPVVATRVARAIDLVYANRDHLPREHVEAIAYEAARIALEVARDEHAITNRIMTACTREAYQKRDAAEREAERLKVELGERY